MIPSLTRKVLRSVLSFGIGYLGFSSQAKKKAEAFASTFFFPSLLFFFSKDRHVGLHFLREGHFIFAVTLLRDTLEFSLGAHFISRCDLLFHMPSDCMMCAF